MLLVYKLSSWETTFNKTFVVDASGVHSDYSFDSKSCSYCYFVVLLCFVSVHFVVSVVYNETFFIILSCFRHFIGCLCSFSSVLLVSIFFFCSFLVDFVSEDSVCYPVIPVVSAVVVFVVSA